VHYRRQHDDKLKRQQRAKTKQKQQLQQRRSAAAAATTTTTSTSSVEDKKDSDAIATAAAAAAAATAADDVEEVDVVLSLCDAPFVAYINQSPFQLPSSTTLRKAYFLFHLLRPQVAYITRYSKLLGRLTEFQLIALEKESSIMARKQFRLC
jgi:hypothetical protein